MPPHSTVVIPLIAFYVGVLALAIWNLFIHMLASPVGYEAFFSAPDVPRLLLFGSYLRPFDLEGMAVRDAVIATTGFVIAVTALFVVVIVMMIQIAERRRRLIIMGSLNVLRIPKPLIVPLPDDAGDPRVYRLEIDIEVPQRANNGLIHDLIPDLKPALEAELQALAEGRLVQLSRMAMEDYLTVAAHHISDGMINRVRVRRATFEQAEAPHPALSDQGEESEFSDALDIPAPSDGASEPAAAGNPPTGDGEKQAA